MKAVSDACDDAFVTSSQRADVRVNVAGEVENDLVRGADLGLEVDAGYRSSSSSSSSSSSDSNSSE